MCEMKWRACTSEKGIGTISHWGSGAALNGCWFCSAAAQQSSLWFPSLAPKALLLRATAILVGSLQSLPTGTGRRAK